MNLEELLIEALDRGASDIHVLAGRSPVFRINTELIDSGFPTVTEEMASELVRQMVGTRRYAQFLRRRDLDFSAEVPGRGRFRVNSHFQRDSVAIAFRAIPNVVPALDSLNLPPVVSTFTDLPRGLGKR